MKILVGYDGSVPADGALYDLQSAGLPARTEALVLTASAPWAPYGPGEVPMTEGWSNRPEEGHEEGPETGLVPEEARETAEKGAHFLRERFPQWTVSAEAVLDDAAHGLLARAEDWKADLIDLGTPDRSAIGRFLRGSVTQKVLHHAQTGVRIARPRLAGRHLSPLFILAMDGSPGADQALQVLVSREWPSGTQVRVVAAMDRRTAYVEMMEREEAAMVGKAGGLGGNRIRKQSLSWIERKVESSCTALSAAGLEASSSVVAGDPRHVLIGEARDWGASAIFMGARGLNPVRRFVLGSVSSAVASHAPCTVEVVHSSRMSASTLRDRSAPKRNSNRHK